MSRPRAPKKDANHGEIVAKFLDHGASVLDVSSLPGEALDIVVGYSGIDQRVEIKDGAKVPSARKLTDSEAETFRTWKGRPPIVVACLEDVTAVLVAMRDEAVRLSVAKSMSALSGR